MERRKMLAIVGFVVTVPALLICLLGPLGLEPPALLTHPVVILGGLALALAMNTLPVARVNARMEDGNFVGSVTISLKDSLMNFGVIALCLVLLAIITLYLFVENFQPR
jgi:hypothetical protein